MANKRGDTQSGSYSVEPGIGTGQETGGTATEAAMGTATRMGTGMGMGTGTGTATGTATGTGTGMGNGNINGTPMVDWSCECEHVPSHITFKVRVNPG